MQHWWQASCNTAHQACNQGARDGKAPFRKMLTPLEKRVGHSFKIWDIVQKSEPLSENFLPLLVSQAGYRPAVDEGISCTHLGNWTDHNHHVSVNWVQPDQNSNPPYQLQWHALYFIKPWVLKLGGMKGSQRAYGSSVMANKLSFCFCAVSLGEALVSVTYTKGDLTGKVQELIH